MRQFFGAAPSSTKDRPVDVARAETGLVTHSRWVKGMWRVAPASRDFAKTYPGDGIHPSYSLLQRDKEGPWPNGAKKRSVAFLAMATRLIFRIEPSPLACVFYRAVLSLSHFTERRQGVRRKENSLIARIWQEMTTAE